mmetsp:Transcript_6251/g.17948  ORF Transcript_6251/g.17948 Transcript_6251/m.17948 type:complete len:389 (+) Transcript_6251:300-1466(+)
MESRVDKAKDLKKQLRSLSQRVATHNLRVVAETDALAEEVKSLQTALQDEEKALKASGTEDFEAEEQLATATSVMRGMGPGGDLRKLLKVKNPLILTVLLGRHINVLTMQRSQGIRLKEEYHEFRDKASLCMFGLASVLLLLLHRARSRAARGAPLTLTPPTMVGVQLLLLFMLAFFLAMALRESVLKVNGSRIRSWWIQHHYWGIATCMILLMLPVDSPAVQFCVNKFLWWAWWQSFIMILQNSYQRKRLVTRIAMGKAMAMDVVSGETSGNFGQLLLLYPLLFWLQALQANIGIMMVQRGWSAAAAAPAEGWLDLEQHESDLRGSRGVLLVGLLMLIMAGSNFRNTVATILQKRKVKATSVRRVASQALLSRLDLYKLDSDPPKDD